MQVCDNVRLTKIEDHLQLCSPATSAQIDSLEKLVYSNAEEQDADPVIAEKSEFLAIASTSFESQDDIGEEITKLLVTIKEHESETEKQWECVKACLGTEEIEKKLSTLNDWNPKLNTFLSNMEQELSTWVQCISNLLKKLLRIEPFCIMLSAEHREMVKEMVTDILVSYEKALDLLVDVTIKAREEHLRDHPQPPAYMAFLWTGKNRNTAGKHMGKKKQIMDELNQTIFKYLGSDDTGYRRLVDKISFMPDSKSNFLTSATTGQWETLEAQQNQVIDFRLNLAQDNQVVGGRAEIMQHESFLDNHLKRLLGEWETSLDKIKEGCVQSAKLNLAIERFPQTKKMTERFKDWEEVFKKDWEKFQDAYNFQARISQGEVTRLGSQVAMTKQKLNMIKRQEESSKKVKSKHSDNAVAEDTPSQVTDAIVVKADMEDEGEDDQKNQLTNLLNCTHQKQLEQCLRFRTFAVKNVIQKQRLLLEYFCMEQWCLLNRRQYSSKLCGQDGNAMERLKVIVGRMLIEKMEERCSAWVAERNERQLVLAEERENEKRQRKLKKQKQGSSIMKGGHQRSDSVASQASTDVQMKEENTHEKPHVELPVQEEVRNKDVEVLAVEAVQPVEANDNPWILVDHSEDSKGGKGKADRRKQGKGMDKALHIKKVERIDEAAINRSSAPARVQGKPAPQQLVAERNADKVDRKEEKIAKRDAEEMKVPETFSEESFPALCPTMPGVAKEVAVEERKEVKEEPEELEEELKNDVADDVIIDVEEEESRASTTEVLELKESEERVEEVAVVEAPEPPAVVKVPEPPAVQVMDDDEEPDIQFGTWSPRSRHSTESEEEIIFGCLEEDSLSLPVVLSHEKEIIQVKGL